MRRIITGTKDNRSHVMIDEKIGDGPLGMLWDVSPAEPLGYDPSHTDNTVPHLAKGHSTWRVVTLPPDSVMREMLQQGSIAGLDERGFHTTQTIDYIVVLDGPVTLALDDDEVDLQPGDVVVQRATHHAWSNRNDYSIRLLCLLIGV